MKTFNSKLFHSDAEELEVYRSILKKMNAVAYIVNLDPYRVDWVSANESVVRVNGLSPTDLMKKGEYIYSWLSSSPDFEESVSDLKEKMKEDPDKKWAGVFRMPNEDKTVRWVLYSTATLECDEDGTPSKLITLAFSETDLFNTPNALKKFHTHIAQTVYSKEIEGLTSRQKEILILLALGTSRQIIAEKLQISTHTVDDHKKALFKKYKCRNLGQLTLLACKFGLV